MKPAPLLVYTVLRLLAFLVPLAILWFFFPIFREFWWLAAIFAALIGTSISMLFLRRPLSEASTVIHERREGRGESARQADADAEDSVLDGAEDAAGAASAEAAEPDTKA
ncbi:DUF4229 domain-containing protein [Microbacterium oxydans]|uniref:Mechanosensitive ion channel protein MscS n=1 Tax=Microbacterium oxydans TaxID=82380 RepID=A0A0F0L9H8_9MICO|nr:DUF4229 domain-containing protein [Microbacterium oxydans]KJL29852.1 hypothetical protein RS83_01423 [Microbacterium oxydans]